MLLYTPFSSHRNRSVILSQAGTDADGYLHAHTLTGALGLTHRCTHVRAPHPTHNSEHFKWQGFAGTDKPPGVNSQSKPRG